MEKQIPKDQFGRVIKEGDLITYPVRGGSSVWMSTSLVTSIEYREIDRYERTDEGSWAKVKELEPRLNVVGRSTSYSDEFRGLYKSCVYRYDRATIVERDCHITPEGDFVIYDEVSGAKIKVYRYE